MRAWLSGRRPRLGNRGNVALMTAIVAPILLLVGGFSVDYGYASYLNRRLAQATDNAVLSSVSQSAATAGGGFSNTAWLQAYGNSVFAGNISDLKLSNVSFNLQVTSNGTGGVNSVGSYTYNYPTFFAGLIGISSMPLTSQIKASANPITYIDYYILVDVSQSMGIGATDADMKALYQRVINNHNQTQKGDSSGCVFGCHVIQGSQNYTNEVLAHNTKFGTPITLRIDAAVSAIQSIISQAQASAGTNKNIRVGLYTINRDPTKSGAYITQITAPSSDYSTLLSQADAIDLGTNTSSAIGDSDFPHELAAFNSNYLKANGSGASAISPKNYVFLVTDGEADTPGPCTAYNVCTGPFDDAQCTPLKSKATLGVIYTTYNTIYNNPNDTSSGYDVRYQLLVAPYINQIPQNLQNCSTDASKFYFEAKDGPALNTAMQALFASTLQNARLTQ